jgi:uncharacterized membrane protein
MNKTKYIATRLSLIALATLLFVQVVRFIAVLGTDYGFTLQQVGAGISLVVIFSVMGFWLSSDYDMKKLGDK